MRLAYSSVFTVMFRSPFFWPLALVMSALIFAAVLLAFGLKPVDVPAPPSGPAAVLPGAKTSMSEGLPATGLISPGMTPLPSQERMVEEIDPTGENVMLDQPWEKAINNLLGSDNENDQVAASLAAMVPTLPLEGQVEAVQHMVNLLDDEEYGLAQNMVLNPGLHPELSEVLFSDVIARPNRVKLPVLVMLVDSPGHPLRMEAHTSLQEVLGQDLGDAPTSWAQPVQDFLAREAAEAALEEIQASDAAP